MPPPIPLPDREKENYQLKIKTDNVKNVLQILKTVNFRDMANVVASETGLKVTVEEAKVVQANAFIQSDLFQEYEIKEEMLNFRLDLTNLIECLSFFGMSLTPGDNPSLKVYYERYGSPLEIHLEEMGMLTICNLNTEEPDDTLDFDFFSSGVINKIIMRSECLKEVFSELDQTGEVLEVYTSPDPPHFRLSTFGNHGINHTDIPKESEMVETFHCNQSLSHRYRLSHMRHTIRPLAAAAKVSVRTDLRGFLCLQFMVKADNGQTCYIEHFCCPFEDESD